LTAGCVNTGSQPNPAGTTWVLAGFGTGNDVASTPATTISLTFGDSGSASGNGGVNGYSVSYTADPGAGKLTFGQIAATLMAGPAQFMADEDKYFASLANITSYKLTDSSLALLDKDGHTLLTFTTPLKNTAWTLVSYTAPAASVAAQPLALITLSFDDNGTIFGTGGINQFTGTWKLDGTKLTIADIASTKAAGAPALMAQEDEYFALLPSVSGFSFDMGTLRLTDSSGKPILIFKNMLSDTTWELTSVNGIAPPQASKTVTLRFDTTGTLAGQAPVNTYGGTWRTTGIDTLTVSDVISTLMASVDDSVNAYETQYYRILNNASDYRIADGILTLTDHNSNTMLFAVNVADQLKGTFWTLAGDSSITLVIGDDGTLSGQAPVNVYTANAVFSKNQVLSITSISTTKMTGPADMVKKETSYLTSLGDVAGYNLVDGQLVLTGPGGAALLTYNQA
ncbi:MAG: META domain-containing protein, partial [Methanocalculaceae archaeon]|nr:META domain-containing protein [Methanocalculaceae archaeon]